MKSKPTRFEARLLLAEYERRKALAESDFEETDVETDFESFIRRVRPSFRILRHHKWQFEAIDNVLSGEITRLAVFQPPGTSKSEVFSRLLPAYYLKRFPAREVGLVSYGAHLAHDLSNDAKDIYLDAGGGVSPSKSAKDNWGSLRGGEVWASGVLGPIRGHRFHLGIIDDPHKGTEELESEIVSLRVRNWYTRTWLNRQNLFSSVAPAIILVMQRLATNDLGGFVLSLPDAEKWHVLSLDAIRGASPMGEGQPGTWFDDPRVPGELLCPEILDAEKLLEQESDPDTFAAQFQQRPVPSSGEIFNAEWFPRIKSTSAIRIQRTVIGVDLAVSTKDSADYTVAFPVSVGYNGVFYLHRPFRARAEAPDSRTAIAAIAQKHRAAMIAVESVAFQLSFVQELRRMPELRAYFIKPVEADRDKLARARGWSHLAKQGSIVLVDDDSGWVETFLDEAKTFPRNRKDQIDSVGIAMEAVRALDPNAPIATTSGRITHQSLQLAGVKQSR